MVEMVRVVPRGNKYVTVKEADLQAAAWAMACPPLQISSVHVRSWRRKTLHHIRTSRVTLW